MKSKTVLSSIFVITILTLLVVGTNPATAQTDAAFPVISTANTEVRIAFEEVKNAENAGVKVTDLVTQLNVATDLLAKAENAYRTGESNTAERRATLAISIAQQVATQAKTALEPARIAQQNALITSIVVFIVASILLVIGLFLAWRFFSRRYAGSLLGAKTEVVNH